MLGTSLKARHLGRYKDVVVLLSKYARLEPAGESGEASDAQALAADMERLGPTFIKLGQLLSTRPDLLPQAHLDALARLQDKVEPFAFEDAVRIIEADLDVRSNKIFREIDPLPAAAASLAQIHRAVLRDGRVVAVKVQRPGQREIIVEDMAAIGEAAHFLDRHTALGRRYEFARILEEFRKSLLAELDFGREALNLRILARNLAPFDRLVVPAPHEDFTADRVLTMDFVAGRKITTLSPLALNEVEGPKLADQLFRAYLKQILVDGFFHADPHPGNVLLTRDGRVAILDLGMVGRVGPELQRNLLSFLLAISDGRSDDASAVAVKIGRRREGFAEGEFRERIEELVLTNRESTISQLNFGQILFDLARYSATYGLRTPTELTMIGKALLNLDQVVARLDPDFEPSAAVRSESSVLLRESMEEGFSVSGVTAGLLEAQKFAEGLPQKVNKVLDVLGGNELRVKVDALDEQLLIHGMQKIANRISLGLVLASLVIGAALMMRVETPFRILGYPGLAIVLFLAAAAASGILALDILYYDDKRRSRVRGSDVKRD
ncbi:MAG TPA: AarF/UbiB family protein [Elusimicrobiota bacterium]|nr:AarF/UbiB family protein [Elusimicrobiota bacterium]